MSVKNNIPPLDKQQSSLITVLETFFTEKAKQIHTSLPCEVLSVNHDKGCVTVRPIITTMWREHTILSEALELPFPEIPDLPVKMPSAQRGNSGLRLPVEEGDIGEITFSSRNTENYLSSTGEQSVSSGTVHTLGLDGTLQGLCYEGELFTSKKPRKIPKKEVILEYGDSVITLKDGNIDITANSGTVTANGATITRDGDVITKSGVSLDKLKEAYDNHLSNLH